MQPYYLGNPAISSGYMTSTQVANEMRHIASVIPLDSFRADDRSFALTARASDIDAGLVNPKRDFRVLVDNVGVSKPRKTRVVAYPYDGRPLFTFDEAWLMLEVFAARRGWVTDTKMDAWAEGETQRFDLGIVYDGIADPMRA